MAEDWFEVVVEIPRGSRNKYEIDHDTGDVWLDRHLFQATVYPMEYGFFPETLADDDDPLDALVLLGEPAYPGVHLRVRVVGMLMMHDEKGRDEKILCVLHGDHRQEQYRDIDDLPEHLLAEISHFFEVYKDLEPGKYVKVGGWHTREEALKVVAAAKANYPT